MAATRHDAAHPPCPTLKDSLRVRDAYAKGSHVFPQLGEGLHSLGAAENRRRSSSQQPFRLAVVMPWVVEASPDAACRVHQAKPEMKAGADCKAFFTLPVSWPYWLASARCNSAIADFLIFHEPGLPTGFFRGPGTELALPANVRAIEVANLTSLYQRQLGVSGLRLNPDKVKDFKPCIGHVFETYLSSYSHWAFGDVDVVYGDLRRFLTPKILEHDIITFRTDDLCASMTKTLFAGQLTIFANNAWGRLLYRSAPLWERVANAERYMFFDERAMAAHALRQGSDRIAMVINQLSDRLFTKSLDSPGRGMWAKGALRGVQRHLIWRGGDDGRLLLVDRRHEAWCAVSEAALVHLQQHKFRHFGRSAAAFVDSSGFVFDRTSGIRPFATLNASGDAHDAGLKALLQQPLKEALTTCSSPESIMERSMF